MYPCGLRSFGESNDGTRPHGGALTSTYSVLDQQLLFCQCLSMSNCRQTCPVDSIIFMYCVRREHRLLLLHPTVFICRSTGTLRGRVPAVTSIVDWRGLDISRGERMCVSGWGCSSKEDKILIHIQLCNCWRHLLPRGVNLCVFRVWMDWPVPPLSCDTRQRMAETTEEREINWWGCVLWLIVSNLYLTKHTLSSKVT